MDAEALLRRYVEGWNTGNPAVVDEVFVHDVVDHREPPVNGIESVKRFVATIRRGVPDLKVTIEDAIVQGDKAALRLMHHGTHSGKLFGFDPTGKPLAFRGFIMLRLRDGKVAERWGELDRLRILQQMGVLPAELFPTT